MLTGQREIIKKKKLKTTTEGNRYVAYENRKEYSAAMASSGVVDKGEEMMAAVFINLYRYIKKHRVSTSSCSGRKF